MIHLNKTHAGVYSVVVFLSLECLTGNDFTGCYNSCVQTGTAATLQPPSFSVANVKKEAKTKVFLASS